MKKKWYRCELYRHLYYTTLDSLCHVAKQKKSGSKKKEKKKTDERDIMPSDTQSHGKCTRSHFYTLY